MNKVVTIHQPNYLPWMGFFSKIKRSDCFVILDNVDYTKNSIINRNKIRIKEGWCYLTIPIEKRYHRSRISDVRLPQNGCWRQKQWKTIETNYKNARYYYSHKDFFEELYQKDFEYLWQINEEIIFYLLNCFDIKVEIIKASELNLDQNMKKTDMLITLLNNIEASIYLSGPSGRNYLEFDKFKKNGIKLEFYNFIHPVYKQRYPGFEPNMAAIDLLFNMGEESKKII